LIFLAAMIAVAPPPAKPPTCVDALAKEAINCQLDAQTSGDSAKAAQGFEDSARALRANDPEAGKLWAAAGNMWIEADQPGKAAFAFDQALAAPGMTGDLRGETLLDRARAAEAQGDLKMARAKLTEAAQLVPDDPFVWYFSAALAIREGDPATARSAIARALALAPNDPTILFEAGHVADLGGDEDQARHYWEQAEARDPNGGIGKAAAKAIEMLGVTPTVKSETAPPK
jgi:tetratricopeptide (TPR) repeat protein